MQETVIRAADGGLFRKGTILGKIDGERNVFDSANNYTGRFKKDGTFVRASKSGETNSFTIEKDGTIRDNDGFFGHGYYIGKIDSRGNIYDKDNIVIATVETTYEDAPKTSPKKAPDPIRRKDPSSTTFVSVLGGVALVFVSLFMIGLIPAFLGSESIKPDQQQALTMTIAGEIASLAAITLYFARSTEYWQRHRDTADIFSIYMFCSTLVTSILYLITMWATEGHSGTDSVFLLGIVSLIMGVLFCLVPSGILSLIIRQSKR